MSKKILLECKFGIVNGGVRTTELLKDEHKHGSGKVWYESVSEPVFESPESVHVVKDGQLLDELPTSKYFTGRKYTHHDNTAKARAGPVKHLTRPFNEINHHLQSSHAQTAPVSPEKWLKENGYKLSDFGLSERNTDPNDMAVLSESPEELSSLDRSYTDSVLSSLGLKSGSQTSGHHKAKTTSRSKTPKKLSIIKQHSKKGDLVGNPHYQRIMQLISLLKDYSKTRTQEESMAKNVLMMNRRPTHDYLSLQHHAAEPITSSERVAEDETAVSDSEAKTTSQAIQLATSAKLNHDFHKRISSTPFDFSNARHHLVTVDTTTGEIFDERNLPYQQPLDSTGISGLLKKTSMGYIPQHVKIEKGRRRTNVSSTRKNNVNKNTQKPQKNTRKSLSRSALLKKITENLNFVETKQLRKLELTLEKIRHTKKLLH